MNQTGTPLRELRQARALSLRDLQDLTGINRAVWSQIENGKLLPKAEQIAALSQALDVPLARWRITFQLVADLESAA